MKHKTWFRLVLKAIGVLLVGMSLPRVLNDLAMLVEQFRFSVFSGTGYSTSYLFVSATGSVLQLALGLYLFFGGKWIVNLCIPSNRPYCPECGYDLSKARSANCPECGVQLPKQPAAN